MGSLFYYYRHDDTAGKVVFVLTAFKQYFYMHRCTLCKSQNIVCIRHVCLRARHIRFYSLRIQQHKL